VNFQAPNQPNPVEEIETHRECRECLEVKPIEKFRKMPMGQRTGTCAACMTRKRNRTVKLINSGIDPEDAKRVTRLESGEEIEDSTNITPDLLRLELWKNYLRAKQVTEKVRCLELLVKMLPDDMKTPMDDKQVVQSLMEAMRKKKRAKLEAAIAADKPTNV
jgi:hypothetical protein